MSAADGGGTRARPRKSFWPWAHDWASTARLLARASRLVAKVDSAAVQDGFDLYLHGFIVAADGKWVVVQQGMRGETKQARRYHWLSEGLKNFVEEPHAGIDGVDRGTIINLTDRRAAGSRRGQLDVLESLGPDGIVREVARLEPRAVKVAEEGDEPMLPHLILPDHHEVRPDDVVLRRLHGTLAAATEQAPKDFAELLLVPGVGARTVKSLAMVAEVVHGAPYRFGDPARFSFAHGGKDGHPFPVPLKVYDQTIRVLKSAVTKAKLGEGEEMAAIKRLDTPPRGVLEVDAEGPSFATILTQERAMSPIYGGRTVADDREGMPKRRPERREAARA